MCTRSATRIGPFVKLKYYLVGSSEDDPVDCCTPASRSRDYLALDLAPDFLHHVLVYPALHHGGDFTPWVRWVISNIVCDRDAVGG